MFLRRALRYRRSQAFVLAGLSLLIGTCAAFAPWFARAVEQTVTTEMLTGQPLAAAWQLQDQPAASSQGVGKPRTPEDLARLVPADLKPLFSPPVNGQNAAVVWTPRGERVGISGRLVWRDGYCEQLVLTAGRCPGRAGEVVVSTTDVDNHGSRVGDVLDTKPAAYVGGGTLRIVGLYRPADQQALYWYGRGPTGHSHISYADDPQADDPPASDYLLTERSTFDQGVWGYASTIDTRPLPGDAGTQHLDRLREATTEFDQNAQELGFAAANASELAALIDRIQGEQRQGTTIIPLVMVQVALFGLVVLALALAAVVDQRRPELAAARLRGGSVVQAGRSLVLELAVPVAVGMLAGLLGGFVLLQVVRATWLDGGAPTELPWAVPVALSAALLAALAVVVWSVRSVVRQPIATLLRRVVPRRRGHTVGIVDVTIIVLASAGLLAALTGGGRGPLPVLAPTLLALAVGLIFAHLLLPLAALVSRRAMRNGRLGLALGALQVSRRPAATRVVAVVAVATALASFAGQTASVAGRNRETRAGYEVGAAGVIEATPAGLGSFTKALDAVDPDRRWLTPVVLTTTASPDAPRSLLIEPDSFRRIAYQGDRLTDEEGFRRLAAPERPAPIELRGEQLRLTAAAVRIKQVLPPTRNGELPTPQPPATSLIVKATVVSLRNGSRSTATFPPLPLAPGRPVDLTTDIDCEGGCRLLRIGIAPQLDDSSGAQGDVVLSKLGTDLQPALPLGAPADWKPLDDLDDTGSIAAAAAPAGGLTVRVTSTGAEQHLQHTLVPVVVPALITPDLAANQGTTVPGLDGVSVRPENIGRLEGPVNRHSERVAVMDLETLRRLGGTVTVSSTAFEVWLNAEGLAHADEVIAALGKEQVAAKFVDRIDERVDAYGRSASALALKLTPVVGIAGLALAIAVLLLMTVTSWRSRAQDYASLKVTGVPATTTGRAARWEQTGPVVLAVLLGTACGAAGARIALPLIPLFADTGQVSAVPLDLGIDWSMVLALWVIGTVALTAVTLLLGSGINRRARYSRIREELW
ncbi:hypothetical protein GCM10009789_74700 [Kribbella sancticallisti]|uniref:ABC3 transporter permease C-terminal domain-containing protein n=1 Tax=Kribbella sancticallisti TaxID=460087 RepID=A0ABP4QKZ4_9ACTN